MISESLGALFSVIASESWTAIRARINGAEPDVMLRTADRVADALALSNSERDAVARWLSQTDVFVAIAEADLDTAEVTIQRVVASLEFEMGQPTQKADRIENIVITTVLEFARFVDDPQISAILASTGGVHDHLRRDQSAIMDKLESIQSQIASTTPRGFTEASSSRSRSSGAAGKLVEYRCLFSEFCLQGLPELVTATATVDGTFVEVDDVLDLAVEGQVVALVGKSGYGKTHLARHTAIRFANRCVNPIWIQAGEYQEGRLSALLSGATSTFGIAEIRDILDFAISATPSVIIADGFVGAPHERRLVEELQALRNQYPGLGVIITSTVDASFPSTTVTLTLQATNDSTRTALFRSYQIPESIETGDAFRTPFEIAVFSKVYANLGPTVGFLVAHDAYIEQCCRHSTQLRHALRRIAGAMTEQIRTSLSRSSARQILEQAGVTPETIDAVFECPLLTPDVYNTRFIHDLHCERLAAEQIRANVTSASDFALALAGPRNAHFEIPRSDSRVTLSGLDAR